MAALWISGYFWNSVLLGCLGIISLAQELTTTDNSFYDDPDLICGDDSLEYSIFPAQSGNISLRILAQDRDGKLKILTNDPKCGIWLATGSNNAMEIEASYDGCYIIKKGNYFAMTMFLEYNTTGEWELYQKEDLRCPLSQAMDAPILNKCLDVQKLNRFPCAGPSTSSSLCLQMGCCYDHNDSITPCYYDNKVTARCTREGQLSLAISKDVTRPSLILSSVRFPRGSDAACNPVGKNNAFLLFQFPLSACGTTRNEDGITILYENNLVGTKGVNTWKGAAISRDSTFRLTVQCRFAAASLVPLNAIVLTPPPPLPAPSTGPLTLEMRIAKDQQYGKYYTVTDYPLIKVLREPIFVEVRILYRQDPQLILVLDQCWANPSENPSQQPQWPILVDRCPFTGDTYRTEVVPSSDILGKDFPSHYKRFLVKTFTFLSDTSPGAFIGLVYLHCSASLCTSTSVDSCTTICSASRRKRGVHNSAPFSMLVSSPGPITFLPHGVTSLVQKDAGEPVHSTRTKWTQAVIAVSVGSLIAILVLLLSLVRQMQYETGKELV